MIDKKELEKLLNDENFNSKENNNLLIPTLLLLYAFGMNTPPTNNTLPTNNLLEKEVSFLHGKIDALEKIMTNKKE